MFSRKLSLVVLIATLALGMAVPTLAGSSSNESFLGQLYTWVAKLTADDYTTGDWFSNAATSDDTVVVGSVTGADYGTKSGAAYVFTRAEDGTWSQTARLIAGDGESYDLFGTAVAVDGDIIVVGATGDDDNGSKAGAAYVFTRAEDGTWSQTTKLTASDGAAVDYFGHSVAVSGNTIVVGAPYDDDGESGSGSVYIFNRDLGGTDNWGQAAKLTAGDGEAGDWFGKEIAASTDTLVVVASGYNEYQGAVYVFTRSPEGGWSHLTTLFPSVAEAYEYFGSGVAVNGDTIVVGASGDQRYGYFAGAAYIFRRNLGGQNNWGQAAKLYSNDPYYAEEFGYKVAMNGDAVVVTNTHGKAFVFGRNQEGQNGWNLVTTLTPDEEDSWFMDVSMSGTMLALLSERNSSNDRDSVYLFSR